MSKSLLSSVQLFLTILQTLVLQNLFSFLWRSLRIPHFSQNHLGPQGERLKGNMNWPWFHNSLDKDKPLKQHPWMAGKCQSRHHDPERVWRVTSLSGVDKMAASGGHCIPEASSSRFMSSAVHSELLTVHDITVLTAALLDWETKRSHCLLMWVCGELTLKSN